MKITLSNQYDPANKIYLHQSMSEFADDVTATEALRECCALLVCAGYCPQSVEQAVDAIALENSYVRKAAQ